MLTKSIHLSVWKVNRRLIVNFFLIYFGLLFSVGFFFCEQYSRFTSLGFLFLLVLVAVRRKRGLNVKVISYFGLIFLGLALSWMVNGMPEMGVCIFYIVRFINCILLCSIMTKDEFCHTYCHVLSVIAIFSIIGYFFLVFNFPLYGFFPKLLNSSGRIGFFCIFTTISDFSYTGADRVQGIFWEPGAFQAFLIFAMVITYFEQENKKRKCLKEAIYSLCIFLTFSTTGIFALVLFWMFVFLRQFKNLKLFSFVFVTLIVFGVYIYFSSHSSGYINYTIYRKIDQILNYKIGVKTNASSRMDSIVFPILICCRNPFYFLFGYGENGLKEMVTMADHSMFTCTPINYLLSSGVLVAYVSVSSFVRLIRAKRMPLFDSLLLSSLLILCVASENLCFSLFVNIFLCYSFNMKKTRTKESDKEETIRYENRNN